MNGLHVQVYLDGDGGVEHKDFPADEKIGSRSFTSARIKSADPRMAVALILPYGARLRIDPPPAD